MGHLQNWANSCRMCLRSPEMGENRDGGCVFIPGVGTSSGLWDHAVLGSCSSRRGDALSSGD